MVDRHACSRDGGGRTEGNIHRHRFRLEATSARVAARRLWKSPDGPTWLCPRLLRPNPDAAFPGRRVLAAEHGDTVDVRRSLCASAATRRAKPRALRRAVRLVLRVNADFSCAGDAPRVHDAAVELTSPLRPSQRKQGLRLGASHLHWPLGRTACCGWVLPLLNLGCFCARVDFVWRGNKYLSPQRDGRGCLTSNDE